MRPAGVVLAVVLCCGAATPLAAGPVEVDLLRCGEWAERQEDLDVRLELSPEPPSNERRQEPGGAGTGLRFELEPGARTVVVARGPEVWSEVVELAGRPGPSRVVLRIWPRAELSARLEVPPAESPPGEISLRLRPAAPEVPPAQGGCDPKEVTLACAIEEREPPETQDVVRCPVPAGSWNLRFQPEGWSARHVWQVRLAGGARRDLGVLELRHGGTVVGEVTTVDGPADPRLARLSLEPEAAAGMDRAAQRSEASELRLAGRLDEQGFFVFEGVAPGLYSLTVEHEGYAAATRYPIEVADDAETVLPEPVVLAPPGHLLVAVRPVVPAEPWEVAVLGRPRTGGGLEEVARGAVEGETGLWRSPPLAAGSYRLEVRSPRGDVVGAADVRLADGEEERFVPLDLELVEAAGRVQLGDEPIAATLWFGGRDGALRIRATADGEGSFRTLLPTGGEWLVDVEGEDPPVLASGLRVDVGDGDDELRIRLPDTRLAGEVLQPSGGPAAGALVHLLAREGEGSVTISALETTADGRFEASGLAVGDYWLEAEQGGRRSQRLVVQLEEGRQPPWIRLDLRDRRALGGRIVSQAGGVRGALVVAVPVLPGGGPAAAESAVSNASGEVELEVSAAVERLLLFVLPPGFGLAASETPVEDFVVVVGPPAGELLLREAWEGSARGLLPIVFFDGRPFDVGLLTRWAAMHGIEPAEGDLRVPAMPAGHYAYCLATPAEAALVAAGRAVPTRCTPGTLTPGRELVLHRPAAAAGAP